MTGPEHYREAELLLSDQSSCEYACPHSGCVHEMRLIAIAQVHATLALAAASVIHALHSPAQFRAWRKVIETQAEVPSD